MFDSIPYFFYEIYENYKCILVEILFYPNGALASIFSIHPTLKALPTELFWGK